MIKDFLIISCTGNSDKIGTKMIQEAWLAMYTFNSVEGEYFDENPTQYLSVY